MTAKICLSLLYPYLAQAGIQGFDRSSLLAELGLRESSFKKAMQQIPFSKFVDLVHQLITITECPALGLKSGAHYHPSTFGPLSYLMLNSDTIAQAYQGFLSYEFMINEAVKTVSVEQGGLRYHQVNYHDYPAEYVAPLVEAHLASLLAYTKFLSFMPSGRKSLVKEVWFKHAALTSAKEYNDFFDVEVKFNQAENRFVFEPDILNHPIPGADPRIVNRAIMELDAIRASRQKQRSFSEEVYEFINEGLYGELPTAAETADAFAMSTSTFQRRLREESSSFKAVLEQIRKDKAKVHLADARLDLAEVASRLGFSDAPAFFKAFKRWTGETPSDYRKRCADDSGAES